MVWLRCDMCGCALVVPHNFLLSCHDLATGRHNLRLTVYVQLPEHLNIPLGACGLVVCAPILRFSHTPRKYLQNTELDPRLEGTPRWMIYSKSSYRRGSLHRSDGACGPLLLFYLILFTSPLHALLLAIPISLLHDVIMILIKWEMERERSSFIKLIMSR
jgi:hypothetical protein